MIIVEYNGMRLKTPTKVEEFREEFHDGFLYGEGLYVTSYIKHLFPEEYDHVCRETVDDGGGFFKEYIAAYNIFYMLLLKTQVSFYDESTDTRAINRVEIDEGYDPRIDNNTK